MFFSGHAPFYAEICLKKGQLKHFSLSFVEKGDIM